MIFKDRIVYIYCMLYYMLHGSLYLMACGFLLGVSIQTCFIVLSTISIVQFVASQ